MSEYYWLLGYWCAVDHEAEENQLTVDFLFVDFLVAEVIKKKGLQLWIIETTLSWENKRRSPTDLWKVDFILASLEVLCIDDQSCSFNGIERSEGVKGRWDGHPAAS